MAKLGEGDERWIVKERDDGKNVGNWHWSETNCLRHAEDGLREKLVGLDLLQGSAFSPCEVTSLGKCEGDCYTYNRKGKLYLFHDLKITLNWKTQDGIDGSIDLPNVSEDLETEDMEFSVTCTGSQPNVSAVKDALRRDARPLLQALIASFFQDLRNRIQSKTTSAASSDQPAATATTAASAAPAAKPAQPASMAGRTTVEITQHFDCAPDALYDALTNGQRIMGFTSAPAMVEARVGGKFEMFAGAISGEIKELVPNQKIVETWRMKSWPETVVSEVIITITGGTTTSLHLVHRDIPKRDSTGTEVAPQVEHGWQNNFFSRLRSAYGWRAPDL